MRKLSHCVQLIVAAASVAIVLAVAVAPSMSPRDHGYLASRFPQRGRVARFYGRNSQRSATAPLQTARQGQWNRGMRPLGW